MQTGGQPDFPSATPLTQGGTEAAEVKADAAPTTWSETSSTERATYFKSLDQIREETDIDTQSFSHARIWDKTFASDITQRSPGFTQNQLLRLCRKLYVVDLT